MTGFSPAMLQTGRDPLLPSDLLFDMDSTSFGSEAEYVQDISSRLQKTYGLVRKTQYSAHVQNKARRNQNRYQPHYTIGQQVFYWENAASESRIQDGDEIVSCPKKWQFYWQGPFPILSKNDDLHYTIDKKGTPIKTHINRLSKQNIFSPSRLDTSDWIDNMIIPEEVREFVIPDDLSVPRKLSVGEIIVFPTVMDDFCKTPFGVARITEISEETSVQWYGNRYDNLTGTYRRCWIDPKDNKYYYSDRPTHRGHMPFINHLSEMNIEEKDIVAHGFTLIDHNDRLTSSVFQKISDDPSIAWQIESD